MSNTTSDGIFVWRASLISDKQKVCRDVIISRQETGLGLLFVVTNSVNIKYIKNINLVSRASLIHPHTLA